jgi:hypothetical protein
VKTSNLTQLQGQLQAQHTADIQNNNNNHHHHVQCHCTSFTVLEVYLVEGTTRWQQLSEMENSEKEEHGLERLRPMW